MQNNHKTIIKTIFLACFATFFSYAQNANAVNANNFYIDDFTADYYLERDDEGNSHLRVIETITAIFPNYLDQNHGITRTIPFTNQNGKNLTMPSDHNLQIQVFRNNQTEKIDHIDAENGYFTVYIGDKNIYQHGEQTYRLEYEFQDVIINDTNNKYQVLYWDTNGNDSYLNFNRVTARLHIDPELKSALTPEHFCYVGLYGEIGSNRCTITEYPDYIEFTAENLTSQENLTFVAEFQPNTFAPIPVKYNWRIVILLAYEILFMIIVIIFAIRVFHETRSKRQYWHKLFLKPEYSPPTDLTVAEIAKNYPSDFNLGNSKVTTLLELAVNHKIQLLKIETDNKKKASWVVRILSLQITPTQNDVLRMLAGSITPLKLGQEIKVETHSPSSSLVSLSQNFNRRLESSLIEKQLLLSSSKTKKKTSTRTAEPQTTTTTHITTNQTKNHINTISKLNVLSVGYLIIFMFLVFSLFDYIFVPYLQIPAESLIYVALFFLLLIPPITAIFIGRKNQVFYTHTEKGLAYIKYLDGLKLYIKMAEQDRLNFLQSVTGTEINQQGILKLYEKLLPYAVLLKLEKSWLNTLEQYYEVIPDMSPDWYVDAKVFSANSFSHSISSFNSTVGRDITHSTTFESSSSSFSSSSGSSGFSGGGGGGGGVGGW